LMTLTRLAAVQHCDGGMSYHQYKRNHCHFRYL
jgi:hypothetical protein